MEDEKRRRSTKLFCVFSLAIAAIFFMPTKPLIYVGALLSVIGDFCMLNKHNKSSFLAGSIYFILGHGCYLAEMILITLNQNVGLPYYYYIIFGGLLFSLVFVLYPFTKKVAGRLSLVGNFYMPFLLVMAAFGVYAAIKVSPMIGGVCFALGYGFFFVSDTTLVCTTFKKDMKRRDFYIMLSYLLGEAFIVMGLLMMNGLTWA